MENTFGISIIGAGRVGWHLAQGLSAAGHPINEIWSRRHSQAQELAERLPAARVVHTLDFSQSPSRLFLLTAADAALEELVRHLILPTGALLAHTSGSQPLDILKKTAGHTGVFYPLQTFSKEKPVDFTQITICLEAADYASMQLLDAAARALGAQPLPMSTQQRRQLHLAAVFASNFSNHLLRIAHELLQQSQLPAALLDPLIRETLEKALSLGPAAAQTGPALRGDAPVMEQHLRQLFGEPAWLELYRLLSADIQKWKKP
ncbi:Rossmann-like and DUF2520 domain-containing protein [Cesiribacter andamanensis]|uniref:DUF2520 domain-containing protein n=1 Tax=Cesiribacter andamanensis AMV16 TaxID=1279009 RepID=M7NWX9_9BACT|nr:Rossmann-like and DUF2520 domain-containing protein [Cesiribacter andamanensis]EMR02969.1 hypothetical protein ADICEAN_01876 [Cesiribacter andamanensis AMV16]